MAILNKENMTGKEFKDTINSKCVELQEEYASTQQSGYVNVEGIYVKNLKTTLDDDQQLMTWNGVVLNDLYVGAAEDPPTSFNESKSNLNNVLKTQVITDEENSYKKLVDIGDSREKDGLVSIYGHLSVTGNEGVSATGSSSFESLTVTGGSGLAVTNSGSFGSLEVTNSGSFGSLEVTGNASFGSLKVNGITRHPVMDIKNKEITLNDNKYASLDYNNFSGVKISIPLLTTTKKEGNYYYLYLLISNEIYLTKEKFSDTEQSIHLSRVIKPYERASTDALYENFIDLFYKKTSDNNLQIRIQESASTKIFSDTTNCNLILTYIE